MSGQAETPESTPLFAAIAAGNPAGVRAALDSGASVRAPNAQGDPPLLAAIVGGDPEIVGLLLEAGADSNQPGAAGEPPLVLAARLDAPVLQGMAQRGENVQAGRFAALLEILVNQGADLCTDGAEAARYGVINANLSTLMVLDRLGLVWTAPDRGAGLRRKLLVLVSRENWTVSGDARRLHRWAGARR
jgi:hypothetical protein